MTILELSTAQTYPLRLSVLRRDTPTKVVTFSEDDWPGAWHLGVGDETGAIVAISSWVPRACPALDSRRGVQLRGMATAPEVQGTGVGGQLLEAGAQRATEAGFDLLWANARDSALGFYTRHGCSVTGTGFIDATTRLPHHLVVRWLV